MLVLVTVLELDRVWVRVGLFLLVRLTVMLVLEDPMSERVSR